MKTITTFPHIGFYTPAFANIFKKLGSQVLVPAEITEEMIKKGVRYSPEMICFPFKVSLGSLIDSLEKGANAIVHFDTCGQCRFRHYWIVQKQILNECGYKFKIIPIGAKTILKNLKELNLQNSYFKILKILKEGWEELNKIEKTRDEFNFNIDKKEINILIFGEIYTVLEYAINFDVVRKLRKLGAKPKLAVSLSHFIGEPIKLRKKPEFLEEAKRYINGPIGGHGLQSIAHTIHAAKKGFDGVLHIEPLSCMPEITVEPAINSICRENGISLLRMAIDETNSELNLETRLETFIEIIKKKKYGKNLVRC